jgi:hypothetical protein
LISQLSINEKDILIKRLLRITRSPLAKIHIIHILTHSGDHPSYSRLAQRFIKKLISNEGEKEAEAFLSILNWVNNEISHRQDAINFSSNLRLALVWTHAHRLFLIFIFTGAPVDWLAKFFKQANEKIPTEILTRDPKQWYDVAHPRNVSEEILILHGLSYGLRDVRDELITSDLRSMLVKMALHEAEGIQIPAPVLMRDTTHASNSLSSFLSGDRGELFLPLLGMERASIFTRTALRSWPEEALNRLSDGSNQFSDWGILSAVMGDFLPDESLAQRFKKFIRKTEFADLYRKNGQLGNLAILSSSQQLKNFADQDLRDLLKNQLVKIAQVLADSKHGELNEADGVKENLLGTKETWGILLDSAFNISLAVQMPENVIPEFIDILRQMVGSWPELASMYRPVIQRFCEELPIYQAKQFWPLLIHLRALS